MSLTELVIRGVKEKEKTYLISDGKGLSLEIRPNGRKYWIIRYWTGGKEHRSSVGTYPDVSLKEARDKNYEFRKDLQKSLETGKPIGADKETFAMVAEEWISKRMKPTAAESYLRTIRLRLDRLIYPVIGNMKLDELTSGTILQLCRKIEDKGTVATAARVKMVVGQVFNYAIATSRADVNPTLALRNALQARKAKHYATITEPDKIGILIRQIEAYPYLVIRCAMKFSALVFCRPGEVRRAEWKEIDWEKAVWRIPAEKMKMEDPHIVPLARQTHDILKEIRPHTGGGKWIFPSARDDGRCMSENAVRVALRSMGYANEDMTAHGFRGMASTQLNEAQNEDGSRLWSVDAIERQLAHAERNSVRDAYNHAQYMPERIKMVQWWADLLDELRDTGKNT